MARISGLKLWLAVTLLARAILLVLAFWGRSMIGRTILFLLFVAGPSFGAVVLAPGEVRTIGGEQVACSIAGDSTFAKVYYSFKRWNKGYPYGTFRFRSVSENGFAEEGSTTVSLLDNDAQMKVLIENRSLIRGYTEVAICGLKFERGVTRVYLNSYVFTAKGRVVFTTKKNVGTMPDCIETANDINSR